MKKSIRRILSLGLLSLGLTGTSGHASIVLDGTRVIYPGGDREVSIRLTNNGAQPVVAQAWLDDGDAQGNPSRIKAPFILMPPLARIDAGKSQTLRLIYAGDPLPQDRESVYYLNVLEIPPKPASRERGENVVQVALRSRVKVFYRPSELGTDSGRAHTQLNWKLLHEGLHWTLEGSNPTPYHVSLTEVTIDDVPDSLGSGMLAPGETLRFPLAGTPAHAAQVNYTAIDDYGATRRQTRGITR
jgi:P pilus assembly chaperone PapD